MIKEKNIQIRIVGRTIKKYQKLGYVCKVGDFIEIDINHADKQSHVKITAICDKCKKEHILSVYAYYKNYIKGNRYLCNNCKQEKIEETNMKRYGVKRPLQNKDIRKKAEDTNMEKYGFNAASKNTDVINKLINTNLLRYNVISTAKLQEVKDKQLITNRSKLLDKYKSLNILSINSSIYGSVCTFFCEKKHNFELSFSNLYDRLKYNVTLCTICNPINSFSDKEKEIHNFIKSVYTGTIIINDRKILEGKELDVYLPDLKLAFEFNGLYWHSDIYKNKDYHYNKTKKCMDNNIQLIHIYEDEWKFKQNIVKSTILNKLCQITNRIYAKKCNIKIINDNNIIRNFLDNNHIQGYDESSIGLGLFYNNELISLMTFKKNNINFELTRFCNKINTIVIEGFSKLLNYFFNNYKFEKIITFIKLDHYENFYEKFFNLVERIQPDYLYIVNGKRTLEFENNNRCYYKIYDCGSLKYEIIIP